MKFKTTCLILRWITLLRYKFCYVSIQTTCNLFFIFVSFIFLLRLCYGTSFISTYTIEIIRTKELYFISGYDVTIISKLWYSRFESWSVITSKILQTIDGKVFYFVYLGTRISLYLRRCILKIYRAILWRYFNVHILCEYEYSKKLWRWPVLWFTQWQSYVGV